MTGRRTARGTTRGGSPLEETLAWQIRAEGLPPPRREYRFCPKRLWRADFAWPERMLLVECEGGIFARAQRGGQDYGWHQSVARMLSDMEKYNMAALMGFRVLRYSAREINGWTAIAQIKLALAGGIRTPRQTWIDGTVLKREE